MIRPSAHTAADRALVYDATRWQSYLWRQRADHAAVHEARIAVHDALVGQDESTETGRAAFADAMDFGRETFARLYDEPELTESPCSDTPWATEAHGVLDALPEWQALRASVAGDPDFSALAASEVLRAVAAKLPQIREAIEEKEAQEDEQGDGDGPGDGAGAPDGTPGAGDRVRAAIRAAVAQAAQGVEAARCGLGGLAPGLASAPATHEQGDDRRMRLIDAVRKNPELREVLRRAGQLQRIAAKRRRIRSAHARDEVVDVERGGDVARLLPAALAGLASDDETIELVALRDIAERTAMQYRLAGKEPQGRGPIVVLCDRSGSMLGDGIRWANAVCAATLGIAAKERRACAVLHFDIRIVQHVALAADGATRVNDTATTGFAEAVLAAATVSAGGGTAYGPAFQAALDAGVLQDRADLVVVTDGYAECNPDVAARLAEARTRGLRVFAITVAAGKLTPSLRALCDEHVHLGDERDPATAAARCLP